VVFERSDEGSIGSQSAIELGQDDDDSTISDYSNSSSSIIVMANEKQPNHIILAIRYQTISNESIYQISGIKKIIVVNLYNRDSVTVQNQHSIKSFFF